MSNEPTGTNEIEYSVETELSEGELLSIGKIVALWVLSNTRYFVKHYALSVTAKYHREAFQQR
jgi:hypothetical protein